MRLLLFSNSTNAGEEYLSYTLPYINSFLDETEKNALFIPYAGITLGYNTYFEMVRKKLAAIAIQLSSIHQYNDKKEAVKKAKIIITGGGNTFFLLKSLQEEGLIDIIAMQVRKGIPYIGWSAGSNLVCPTICTTNDMPIVQPGNFLALNLIPFQINPHYTDFHPQGHAGETREMRIREFLLVNQAITVVGLQEGTLLKAENDTISLWGNKPCKIFRYKQTPVEIQPGEKLDFLMQ